MGSKGLSPMSARTSRPSNTVAAIPPNKLYSLIKPVVVSIMEMVGCISDFRLQTAPEIFACFMPFTRALFDDFRPIVPVQNSRTEKTATRGTLC
jgi:hypothetical protein